MRRTLPPATRPPIADRMNVLLSPLGLLLPLTLTVAGIGPAQAQADDMFPSKAAAEARAKQLGCSGAFAMGGEWMPCANFDAYEKAVKRGS